jgi:putative FmdB family regulatory protein
MPIYEYVCGACGQIVEVLQKLSDPPLEECPSGDGGSLTRILSRHNVGGVATGWEGSDCGRSEAGTCGCCDLAGTGCS